MVPVCVLLKKSKEPVLPAQDVVMMLIRSGPAMNVLTSLNLNLSLIQVWYICAFCYTDMFDRSTRRYVPLFFGLFRLPQGVLRVAMLHIVIGWVMDSAMIGATR